MAFFDWNYNGKKDWQDNFIEYQIYRDVTGQNKVNDQKSTVNNGNGMSTFGAVISVIGGLFLFTALFAFLGGDAEDMEAMPIFLIVVFWIICSGVVAFFVGK